MTPWGTERHNHDFLLLLSAALKNTSPYYTRLRRGTVLTSIFLIFHNPPLFGMQAEGRETLRCTNNPSMMAFFENANFCSLCRQPMKIYCDFSPLVILPPTYNLSGLIYAYCYISSSILTNGYHAPHCR